MTGGLTDERVGRVVLTGAHPQPVVFDATLDREEEKSGLTNLFLHLNLTKKIKK